MLPASPEATEPPQTRQPRQSVAKTQHKDRRPDHKSRPKWRRATPDAGPLLLRYCPKQNTSSQLLRPPPASPSARFTAAIAATKTGRRSRPAGAWVVEKLRERCGGTGARAYSAYNAPAWWSSVPRGGPAARLLRRQLKLLTNCQPFGGAGGGRSAGWAGAVPVSRPRRQTTGPVPVPRPLRSSFSGFSASAASPISPSRFPLFPLGKGGSARPPATAAAGTGAVLSNCQPAACVLSL